MLKWYEICFKEWHLEIAREHYKMARQELLSRGYRQKDEFRFVHGKSTAHILEYPEWVYPIYPPRILLG